jgi:hypothetical protein
VPLPKDKNIYSDNTSDSQRDRSVRMPNPENVDDESFLWDGSKLCKRTAFVNANLDSHLTFDKTEGVSRDLSITACAENETKLNMPLLRLSIIMALWECVDKMEILWIPKNCNHHFGSPIICFTISGVADPLEPKLFPGLSANKTKTHPMS